MAHFAEIDENSIVLRVLVVDDLNENDGANFLSNTLGLGGTWIQTSYNTIGNTHKEGKTPLRGNFAGVGYFYDSEKDVFYPEKPYPSWVLNEETYIWEATVPKPSDGKQYLWDEEGLQWFEQPSATV
jgi:hypothetical protein